MSGFNPDSGSIQGLKSAQESGAKSTVNRPLCAPLLLSLLLQVRLARVLYPTSKNGLMDSPLHVCHYLCSAFVGSQNLFPVYFLYIVALRIEMIFNWGRGGLIMFCGLDLGFLITITLKKYSIFALSAMTRPH
jgi:hypothetical protein